MKIAWLLALSLPVVEIIDENYVKVRVDVFQKMDAAEENLPKCEEALEKSRGQIVVGQQTIDELHAAAKKLEKQKQDLEAHILMLESMIRRDDDSDTIDHVIRGWEEVDGTLGLVTGWVVGTGQCVALAWVFNQHVLR